MLVKRNALKLLVSPFSVELFQNIGEFGTKYYTYYRTVDTIQSFFATNGNISGLKSPSEEKLSRDYLINVATFLFAYHQNIHS